MFLTGLTAGGVLLAGWLATRSFARVEEGWGAVLVRFGKVQRDSKGGLRTLGPGLHRKLPWEVVVRYPRHESRLELSGAEHRFAMTGDGIEVRYDAALRYVPDEKALEHYLFGLERPEAHLVGSFSSIVRGAVATFGPPRRTAADSPPDKSPEALIEASLGSYAAIRRERSALQQRLADDCHTHLGARFGLQLTAIDLTDLEPPEQLREPLHGVIQAKAESDAELFRAQGESQQRVLSAREGVEIARQRAVAVETEMRVLGRQLESLERSGVLDAYVARRSAEVLSESRQVFVRGRASAGTQGGR